MVVRKLGVQCQLAQAASELIFEWRLLLELGCGRQCEMRLSEQGVPGSGEPEQHASCLEG